MSKCRIVKPLSSAAMLAAALFVAAADPAWANGDFDIVLSYSNTPTASQASAFSNAETIWESIILDYKDVVSSSEKLEINVNLNNIDGVGGILGSAGFTSSFFGGTHWYASTGSMTFDTSDLVGVEASGQLENLILHEMGHVIGIGTLWVSNGVYVNNSGQYTGADGLAAYNAEFGQSGSFVPVELGGGPGTANGHWDEVDGGGATGITEVDAPNRDSSLMLMTGWLNPNSFISDTTVGSLSDIGYNVVPEPNALVTLGLAGLLLSRRHRRRRRG